MNRTLSDSIHAALAAILLSCAVALPFQARALLYQYDVALQGVWGANPVSPDPPDPMQAVTQWVSIPGSAQVDFPADFLAFEYPYGQHGDYGEIAPKFIQTSLQLDLFFEGHHKSVSGSLAWFAFGGTGYREVHMSELDGLSLWGHLGDVRSIPAGFGLSFYEGFRPPSTYYDYPRQIWTKDAWLFEQERVGPYTLSLSNGRRVPEAGSSAALLGLALAGMLGIAWTARRARTPAL